MFLPLLPAADETLVKATQTFNVILKEINSRLMHMQGICNESRDVLIPLKNTG